MDPNDELSLQSDWDLGFKAPTERLGDLAAEADHFWFQQADACEGLSRLGVTMIFRDPTDDDGRRVIAVSDDLRLQQAVQHAFDFTQARAAEEFARDAFDRVLENIKRGEAGNETKRRNADDRRAQLAKAYKEWAAKGGFDEEDFAKSLSRANGGEIDAGVSTIRKDLKILRLPIETTARRLIEDGKADSDVVCEILRVHRDALGVSEETVRLILGRERKRIRSK
jgi:hypothetical protein